MQNRSRVINRLALVLLSIVVLELVLIGDQVQPVKAIKKKILLKKLKKIIPLMALIKPKKKIILVPIPIPMFKNHGQRYQPHYGASMSPQIPMSAYGPGASVAASGMPPMSFMMMTGEPSGPDNSFGAMTMIPTPLDSPMMSPPNAAASPGNSSAQDAAQSSPAAMMMPSMTMTIQSEPGGGSNIELSTSMMGANGSSLPLQQQPVKWAPQFDDQFEESGFGGDEYYASPWAGRAPLTSPAKLLRNERLRLANHNQRPAQRPSQGTSTSSSTLRPTLHQQTFTLMTPSSRAPVASERLQQRPAQSRVPMLVVRNQWRPVEAYKQQQQQQQFQQQLNQALEFEDLVPVGPPQVMPIYQTPNGQLHLSPPQQSERPLGQAPPTRAPPANLVAPPPTRPPQVEPVEHEEAARPVDVNSEVQTLAGFQAAGDNPEPNPNPNQAQPAGEQQRAPSGRLSSPSLKGKQLQASGKRKPQSAISGGY